MLVSLCACVTPKYGGGMSGPNDLIPPGALLTQGAFSGLNGNTGITGAASIYLSNTQYVLRLEGVNFPSGSFLVAQLRMLNSNAPIVVSVPNPSGTQNLTLSGVPYQALFQSVTVVATQTNRAVAAAYFTRY